MKANTTPEQIHSPKTSAFLEGFARGLLAARPEETTDQARERFLRESAERMEEETSEF